jgi:hypothetical protein
MRAMSKALSDKSGSRPQHAYTDLYDEERRTFLVQYPVWLVVGLGLSGVVVFMLTGFLGFRDPLEGNFTRAVFKEPWALYLWFCALIITLQVSILRHPSLRPQLIATLSVTMFCIIFVGIVYYYNHQILTALQNLLQQINLKLPDLGRFPWTYAVVNFLLIGVFWFSSIRRWIRRASGQPLHPGAEIGVDDEGGDDYPDMQQLVSGDLISGAILVLVLSFVFQATIVNLFSDLLQINVHISTCTVSWPLGACHGGGGRADPPTLSFMDLIQAFVYLPLGLLILALAAVIRGLGKEVDPDSAQSIYARVLNELLDTLRAALNRRGGVAFNLSLALRSVAWPVLILLGTIGVAAAARGIQDYLHLLSDQRTCIDAVHCGGQDILTTVQQRLANFEQYRSAGLALGWGIVAVIGIVLSAALLLFRWRVAENSLRFLGLVGFTVLLTFWIFSLALSGFNALFSLTQLSHRVPFPQPGASTVISFAALVLFGMYVLIRRLRGGNGRTPAPAPVTTREERRQ